MAKRRRRDAPAPKKKNRGFGMAQLRLGMKPIKKNWHFDQRKATKSEITITKRFSDGRLFDVQVGRKIPFCKM